jgi:cytochrome P450
VPAEDRPRLRAWSGTLVGVLDARPGQGDAGQTQRIGDALRQLSAYAGQLIAERRRHPGDDLLSALIDPAAPQPLEDRTAITTAVMLLVAGHETTVNLIANGFLALLRDPEALDRLRREPELVLSLVEEVLRYDSPVQFRPRTTLANVELDGAVIPRGAPLVLLLAAANRDPARFDRADQFVPDREDNQHLAFAGGIHYCLGAPLARLEAQIALTELARRLVSPRLLEDPPPYRRAGPLRGPAELLVEVDRILD